MTRAIQPTRTDGPEVLKFEEISLPEPKRGQTRIHPHAISVDLRRVSAASGAPAAYAAGIAALLTG